MEIKIINNCGIVHDKMTSKFYGVRYDKTRGFWRTDIRVGGNNIYLGAYKDEIHAAYAFNVGFGCFSNSNYTIYNKVDLSTDDSKDISNKVISLLIKKGYYKLI